MAYLARDIHVRPLPRTAGVQVCFRDARLETPNTLRLVPKRLGTSASTCQSPGDG